MKKLYLILAPLAALTASPALAAERCPNAEKWEYGYLALSAIDLAQTLNFGDDAIETNPLFSKHPKPARIVAAKLAASAIHYTAFRVALSKDRCFARNMAIVSVGVQGGIVGLNLRYTFK
jgi:hypothetical protein